MVQTEETELLRVQTAEILRSYLISLFYERLAQVLQSKVARWIVHCRLFLTDWAVACWVFSPPAVQTVLTEAVAARQKNRLFEDVQTNWTAKI